MEHVWVEAFVDYFPSRGAKHKQGEGDTWVKLDPSFKQYSYIAGMDIKTAVPFDAQNLLTQMHTGATKSETQGYITGINSLLVQQTMQDYQARVQNYVQENAINPTIGDVLGRKDIVKQELPYLLGTLPYRTAVKGATFTTIPDSLRHKLSFSVTNEAADQTFVDPDAPPVADTSLNATKTLPELAGKKITLSYGPATVQEEMVINSYLPRPHADGTPIQPSELPATLPAYLVNLKPELRIDGQVVATGAAVGLGGTNIFSMTFSDPAYGASQVTNYVDAGVYQAIGLNLGEISPEQLAGLKDQFEATKTRLQNQDYVGLSKNELIGDPLFATALAYHAQLTAFNHIYARSLRVNALTLPSETLFATKMRVMTLWGIPRYVSSAGLNMDADYLMQVVKAKDGNSDTVKQYMLTSGMTSSALEHAVPEQLFSTPEMPAQGISTAKALKIANDSEIPIYNITQANLAVVLPQLQIGQQVKDEIANAVNAAKTVTVSKSNISYNGWTGCGYSITDPETGAGAYMISGGSSGSDTKVDKNYWSEFDTLFTVLDIKNSIIGQFITSKAFEVIGKSLGIFGTLIQALIDVRTIIDKDSPDKIKKMSSYLLIGSCSAISIIATFLALGVAGGPLFVVTATALTMIAITFITNFIKQLALEAIWSARLKRKNRKEKDVMLA